MDLATVRGVERIALYDEVCFYKRPYGAGIILVTYDSIRFTDVQMLRASEVNSDSAHGTLIALQNEDTARPQLATGAPAHGHF